MWRQTPSGDAVTTKGVETMWADVVEEVAGEMRRCEDAAAGEVLGEDDAGRGVACFPGTRHRRDRAAAGRTIPISSWPPEQHADPCPVSSLRRVAEWLQILVAV